MFKGEVYVAGGDGTEGVGKLFFKNKYCTGHRHPLSSLFGFTENQQWGFYTSTFSHSFNLPLGTGEYDTFFSCQGLLIV